MDISELSSILKCGHSIHVLKFEQGQTSTAASLKLPPDACGIPPGLLQSVLLWDVSELCPSSLGENVLTHLCPVLLKIHLPFTLLFIIAHPFKNFSVATSSSLTQVLFRLFSLPRTGLTGSNCAPRGHLATSGEICGCHR